MIFSVHIEHHIKKLYLGFVQNYHFAFHLFQKAKLGMVLGVYLPTIQHIFGVLMFVRLAYIVGSMGTIEAFAMVFMCCLTVSDV